MKASIVKKCMGRDEAVVQRFNIEAESVHDIECVVNRLNKSLTEFDDIGYMYLWKPYTPQSHIEEINEICISHE